MRGVGAIRLLITIAGLTCIPTLLAQSVREHDPTWAAPSRDAAKPNPLAGQPALVAGGRKLFGQRCNTCHGAEGLGTDRAPSLVAAGVQTQSDGELFWKITAGNTRAGMPSFSFLPEAQRWQLVLYLRAVGENDRTVAAYSANDRPISPTCAAHASGIGHHSTQTKKSVPSQRSTSGQ